MVNSGKNRILLSTRLAQGAVEPVKMHEAAIIFQHFPICLRFILGIASMLSIFYLAILIFVIKFFENPFMAKIEKIETKYSVDVMEHFNNPRNVGSIKGENNIGTGVVGAPACGDVLKLQIKISKDGVIEDAKFRAFGCGSAIASSSVATELIKGKSIEDSLKITNDIIAQKLSLPPIKLHCSMLAEDAIKAAIKDYKSKASLHNS